MTHAIPMPRRLALMLAVLSTLAVLLSGCGTPAEGRDDAGGTHIITDVQGRKVTVPKKPKRILLSGQRELYTTALLNPENPLDKIVGWPDDLKENDADTYNRYLQKFPQIAKIPVTGELWDGSFSLEQALQMRPEVFVLSASSYQAAEEAGIITGFEKAGVPTVVIDYFVEPVKNTVPSVRIMGQLFDREKEAEEFITFYESKVAAVTDRLKEQKPEATKALLWRAPGYFDCCQTFKNSNLSKIVSVAGGANIGDELLDSEQGTLSPEAVAKANPQVILATGANWSPETTPVKEGGFVPLGYETTPDEAAAAWKQVIDAQPVIKEMPAVKDRRAFAAWHHFYDSPYNFLAVEWFAQALHPELFSDLDVEGDFRELHSQFLPVEAGGTFWTGLP